MDRRDLLCRALALAGVATLAQAQVARPPARVGWLGWTGGTIPSPTLALDALRAGLADRGWKEPDNLVLEVRTGERAQAPALAADLLRARVEVIVVEGPLVFLVRGQVGTVPLVFSINGDPVEAGLVASLARPGGQLTGITALTAELTGKRLELLKQARPELQRVALLANDRHPGRRAELAATEAAGQRLGLALKYFPVVADADFSPAFVAIAQDSAGALLAFPDTLINHQARAIAEFSRRQRLPAISGWSEFALAGNLMSYGPVHADFYRLSAAYVDKLLRGAKAAELPVEQPTRFELVLNQRAAAAMGLVLPAALRLRADRLLA